jgi:DNA-binding NarL/FixJ family response regulator
VTRVLVAATSAVTRAGLEAILAREPAFTVVGDAMSSSGLGDAVAEHEPDVVLVEVAEAQLQGTLAMLRLLRIDADDRARPTPMLVILTDGEDGSEITELLDAGVRAVLPRNARAIEIVAAVSAAAAGLLVFAEDLGRMAFGGERGALGAVRASSASGNGVATPLTTREREVLGMLSEGLANKQIAARLGISEHTVKFHVGSVFTKMGASTRAEAVMIGARRGLIVL